jgi:hypothetical protein
MPALGLATVFALWAVASLELAQNLGEQAKRPIDKK